MKIIFKYLIMILTLVVITLFIGYFIYAGQYEEKHPSPYPNCTRMIKSDTINIVIDGKMERKEIKSIVYSCKDGRIIQTNETVG